MITLENLLSVDVPRCAELLRKSELQYLVSSRFDYVLYPTYLLNAISKREEITGVTKVGLTIARSAKDSHH